jgi:transaldolase
MNRNPLRKLGELGQSVWMDFIHRGMLTSGELGRLIEEDGLRGVTSNPSIFEKAIAESQDYDEAIQSQVRQGNTIEMIYQNLTVTDIQLTADLFRSIHEQTDGRDGFVSLEVSPHLAHDTIGTIAEARRLRLAVDRPNVMIKVPGTPEGLPAIRQLIGEGINVNVTLLFGLQRYREVADAYLTGLETLSSAGKPLHQVASVASFFLSRIDVLVDPMLEKLIQSGSPHSGLAASLRGETAIASAKIAWEIYQAIFSSDRFRTLAVRGARPQRLLWASTGTKNPAYSDVKYVEPLIGPETINTMPLETLQAYRDHGNPVTRLAEGLDHAHRVLQSLAQLGINLDEATRQLEVDGVDKFIKPYDQLLKKLEVKRTALLAP